MANLAKTKDENSTELGIQVTYTDDGSVAELKVGDQRHYRVSAINSAGTGMPSASMRSACDALPVADAPAGMRRPA